uniref:Glutamate decarboxylase n=1 Tax=Rhizophora mucronata TaxID=61149 RepID=A0A2P2K4U7_RHIMU
MWMPQVVALLRLLFTQNLSGISDCHW